MRTAERLLLLLFFAANSRGWVAAPWSRLPLLGTRVSAGSAAAKEKQGAASLPPSDRPRPAELRTTFKMALGSAGGGGKPAVLKGRVEGALLGMCAGDALCAPLHWYYNLDVLQQHITNHYPTDEQGRLCAYASVAEGIKHPDSHMYMKLWDPYAAPIDISHDKKELWRGEGTFYHGLLEAGEPTTTVQLALLLARSIVDRSGYDFADYLSRYEVKRQSPHILCD